MRVKIHPDEIAKLGEVEKAQVLELLERFRRQAEWNPLEIYEPHPKQAKCHSEVGVESRAFFGGNRAGKTTMGVVDSLIQAAPMDLVPAELLPYKRFECPFYCRVISPSNDLLKQVIVPKFREWTPRAMCPGESFDKAYSKFDRQIRLECGCRFDLMSHEQELDKFGGAALHRILYDEEPPQDIRDESYARLLDFDGDEIFAMTPLKGLTWMFEDILEAAEKPENAHRITVTIASMLENPYLPDNVRERVMALWGHDDEVSAARIYGNFIHFGGMVLPTWRNAMRSPINSLGEIDFDDLYIGIDPGVVNTGLVWATHNRTSDTLTVFDAYKLQDKDVSEVATAIYATNKKWGIQARGKKRPIYVIDPSARNRTLTHATSVEAEFQNYGIYPRHGQNEVEAGVFQMRRRINHGKLRVVSNLEEWKAEARKYRIQERADGKFAVVKEDDHIMDPTRYISMEVPYLPKVSPIKPKPLGQDVARPPTQVAGQPPREAASAKWA